MYLFSFSNTHGRHLHKPREWPRPSPAAAAVRPARWVELFLGVALWCGVSGSLRASPGIVITNLPVYGTSQNLGGVVTGVVATNYAVAVCIYVPGYGWVSKPTCANPLTPIHPDGSWATDITTGGSDALATRIAAVLVPANSPPDCVQGQPFLTNAFALAAASAVVTRPYPGPRWLRFSGYDWWVKTSANPVGPGPNYFSDSTNNVWVDDTGYLHLKQTYRSNQWQCAEIVSARSFGFGYYRFHLLSDVNRLDPNVVLGLFTWSDDPAFTHREIDIECSRWSNAADLRNAQFVVQPFGSPGHLVRYAVPAQRTNTTHFFNWQSNRVVFQCQSGDFSPNPDPTNVISGWTYTFAPPQPGDENVRLNLWLYNGTPPSNGQEAEVIIQSFEFVPADPPASARLSNPRWTPQGAAFELLTEPDRRYALQSSGDLIQWLDDFTLLATNLSSSIRFPVLAPGPGFFRALTLP